MAGALLHDSYLKVVIVVSIRNENWLYRFWDCAVSYSNRYKIGNANMIPPTFISMGFDLIQYVRSEE